MIVDETVFTVFHDLAPILLEPTLKDLVLIKITNWYDLGLQLDIEDDSLAVIRQNNPQDTASCKREMFRIWLKMAEPCYLKLADALVAIGEENQASQLRQKYRK